MADYKTIKGFKVQSLASDPSAPEGQVWYNTTGNVLKYQASAGTWASGGALTAMHSQGAGFGIQTAGVAAGGSPGSVNANVATVEEYNGSAWTEVNNISTARRSVGGMGTLTAGAIAGGMVTAASALTEEYDGTSWAEGGALNVARRTYLEFAGTQTAGLTAGGEPGLAITELYNGTAWTETADLNTGRQQASASGIQTAALFCGGTPFTTIVESWNGTSWTATGAMNEIRQNPGGQAGPSTAALIWGGNTPGGAIDNTESFDGSSWTEVADLATAAYNSCPAGTQLLALSASGSPADGTATEEWTVAGLVKTVTVS